jgi:gluconate 2-dehydrogenase gamma chain
MKLHRRALLASVAYFAAGALARASIIERELPWHPNAGTPPVPVRPGPWLYFTGNEGVTVEAIADRIIPPDPQTPGGKDAGCAVYLDRQLAGPYGVADGDYNRGPFLPGLKGQGRQDADGPAKQYRGWLAALDRYCTANHGGKHFSELSDAQKDELLSGLESGKVKLEGANGAQFFQQIIKDVQTGFLADPIYGGNRDMVAWKMIGFPGARYNYADWIDHHNERYPYPPVSLGGRADWTPRQG